MFLSGALQGIAVMPLNINASLINRLVMCAELIRTIASSGQSRPEPSSFSIGLITDLVTMHFVNDDKPRGLSDRIAQ